MPDPHVLRDMDAAAARLAEAATRGETVAIFGDYDADGACSAALLAEYLRACGTPSLIHIPTHHRGLRPASRICAWRGRGRNSWSRSIAARRATSRWPKPRGWGSTRPRSTITRRPKGAVVNPNRQDDLRPSAIWCAAGVVFLAVVARTCTLRERGFWISRPAPDLLAALDLVASATVADVVPLTGSTAPSCARGLRSCGRAGVSAWAVLLERGAARLRAGVLASRLSGRPPHQRGAHRRRGARLETAARDRRLRRLHRRRTRSAEPRAAGDRT